LGAQAGAVVKLADPQFDVRRFGVAKLSEFIAQHVPEVRPISRSGLDIVYGLTEWASTADSPPVSSQWVDPWRVWVSPNSKQVLAVDRSTATTLRVTVSHAVASGELEILPAAPELHKEIARAFLADDGELSPAAIADLEEALVNHPESWWRVWQGLLTANAWTDHSRWLAFRHARLQQELVRRLVDGGISESDAERLVRTMRDRPPTAVPRFGGGSQRPAHARPSLRLTGVIHRVVDRMAEDELRRLVLPVGLVVDELCD
jgi:hypothetical protein